MSATDEPVLMAYGDCGVLVEEADLVAAMRVGRVLRGAWVSGALDDVIDLVPAARTVLAVASRPERQRAAARQVREALAAGGSGGGDRTRTGDGAGAAEIEVVVGYDGADLDEVGRLTGLGADGVVDAHTAAVWTVAFAGFAPGFAYLVDPEVGEDGPLAVPRRDEPRTAVPVGAVGLAGPFSGVYPRESPGGWQLIGHTDEAMWDADRDPPARLAPGDRVRFERAERP